MSNPTRTGRIERAWLRDIRARFAEFNKAAREQLYQAQLTVNLQVSPVDENGALRMSEGQIKAYMVYVRNAMDKIILGVVQRDGAEIVVNDEWMRNYILQSYTQALQVSEKQLQASGLVAGDVGVVDIVRGTATPSLVSGAASQALAPIHLDTIAFLHNRAFDSLNGVTEKMAGDFRKVLLNGVEEGESLIEVARKLTERTKVGKVRAELIVRTETIQGYQRGVINTAEQASDMFDTEVNLVWRATLDSRTRDLHAKWHGLTGTSEDMNKRISISPYNCRCSLSIATEETMPPDKLAKMKTERTALLSVLTKK